MKKIVLILTVAIGFPAVTFAQSGKALKLVKGQKYQIENKITTTNSFERQCQSFDNKTEEKYTYICEVAGKEENNYNLLNTITNMKINKIKMGQQTNFNSAIEEDTTNQMSNAFIDLTNHSKHVVISTMGNIVISDTTSLSEIANQANVEVQGYGSQLMFQPLPENIKVGSTWSESTRSKGNSKYAMFIVKEIYGSVAIIDFSGTTSIEDLVEIQGIKLRQKTFGRYSGMQKVDINSGVIQFNTSSTDVSGLIAAPGQDLPVTTKVISTTTTIKIL